jgi:hypothetical protein
LLYGHYPASSLLRASPSPHRVRTCPSPASGWSHARPPGAASRVAATSLLYACCRHYPGGFSACTFRSRPQRMAAFPRKTVGRLRIFPFRGLLDVHCTLRPAYSLSRLMRPFSIGGLAPATFAPTPVPRVRSLASGSSARAWPHSSLVPLANCKLVYLRLLRLLPAGAKVCRVGFAPTGKSRLFTARVFQQNRPTPAVRGRRGNFR